jgi:hypothetical protein
MDEMGPKPPPEEPRVPVLVIFIWSAYQWITWPWQARQMKKAGFRHTGFMAWETGPEGDPEVYEWRY